DLALDQYRFCADQAASHGKAYAKQWIPALHGRRSPGPETLRKRHISRPWVSGWPGRNSGTPPVIQRNNEPPIFAYQTITPAQV
ncbi:MAG: hypothetical protein ACOYOU_18030, partial [Kiritimatiellia bacterium]